METAKCFFLFPLHVGSLDLWTLYALCCMHEEKPPPRTALQRIFLAEATWGQGSMQLSGREAWGMSVRLPLCQPPFQHFRCTVTMIENRENKATSQIFLSFFLSLFSCPVCNASCFPRNENAFICQTESCPTVLGAENFNHSICCDQTQSQAPHLFWLTLKNQFRHPLEQNGAREQSQAMEEKQQSCNRLFVC